MRRLLGLLIALAIACPAPAQIAGGLLRPRSSGFNTALTAAASTYDSDAQAYFAAMSVQPDATRKALLNTLIAGIKSDGDWASLDTLELFASHDPAQAGRLNAVNPTGYSATYSGSPTQTTDVGVITNGTSSYIDTGFNGSTSTHSTRNSATIGMFIASVPNIGTYSGQYDGSDGSVLIPSDGGGNSLDRINQVGTTNANLAPTAAGLYATSRTGSGSVALYYNGNQRSGMDNTGEASTTPNNLTFTLGYLNSYGFPGSGNTTWIGFVAGAGLSAAAHARIYSRLYTYLHAIGAI